MGTEQERIKALLNQAIAEARSRSASRITALHFVVYDSLQGAEARLESVVRELAAGTLAEGAQIVFRPGPHRFICWNCCALRFESEEEDAACPNCGHTAIRIPADITCALEQVEIKELEES